MASSNNFFWPNSGRGINDPDMMYAQVLTPVNQNNPIEVARWNATHPTNLIGGGQQESDVVLPLGIPATTSRREGYTAAGRYYD